MLKREELFELAVDADALASAIGFNEDGTPSPLKDFQREDAAECAFILLEEYFYNDYLNYDVMSVEEKEVIKASHGEKPYEFSFVIDVKLRNKTSGSKVIVDWKTKNTETFDPLWSNRYIQSWQGYVYCMGTGATSVEYRGVSIGGKQKLARFVPSGGRLANVPYYLASTVDVIHHLARGFQIFPQHKPSACGSFGRLCEYFEICDKERNLEFQGFTPDNRISYSDTELFWMCPERYRLKELMADQMSAEEREAPNLGLAVHRAMAVAYRKLKEIQESEWQSPQ